MLNPLFLILIMIISMPGLDLWFYKILNLIIFCSLILTKILMAFFLSGSSSGGNILALFQTLFLPNLLMPFISSRLTSVMKILILISHLFCILLRNIEFLGLWGGHYAKREAKIERHWFQAKLWDKSPKIDIIVENVKKWPKLLKLRSHFRFLPIVLFQDIQTFPKKK